MKTVMLLVGVAILLLLVFLVGTNLAEIRQVLSPPMVLAETAEPEVECDPINLYGITFTPQKGKTYESESGALYLCDDKGKVDVTFPRIVGPYEVETAPVEVAKAEDVAVVETAPVEVAETEDVAVVETAPVEVAEAEEAAPVEEVPIAEGPTLSIELDEFETPIQVQGWMPIGWSPNGDWYEAGHMANPDWESVETWKRDSGCSLPGGCNVVGVAGVLGADKYEDALANSSAVWTGSAWHYKPTQPDFYSLAPEGSYITMYAAKFGRVTFGTDDNPLVVLEIPSCGPNCGQGLLIRAPLMVPGVDLNLPIHVEEYGTPSSAIITEYHIPNPQIHGENFSQGYLEDQAVSSHLFAVNGSGPEDNLLHIQHIFDVTDMSYTILSHTAKDGWKLLFTNVGAYGTN